MATACFAPPFECCVLVHSQCIRLRLQRLSQHRQPSLVIFHDHAFSSSYDSWSCTFVHTSSPVKTPQKHFDRGNLPSPSSSPLSRWKVNLSPTEDETWCEFARFPKMSTRRCQRRRECDDGKRAKNRAPPVVLATTFYRKSHGYVPRVSSKGAIFQGGVPIEDGGIERSSKQKVLTGLKRKVQ